MTMLHLNRPLGLRLKKQGLVLSSWETIQADRNNSDSDDDSSGRRRKWYRLSAKGRKRLASRVAMHRAYQRMIESFLPSAPGEGGGR